MGLIILSILGYIFIAALLLFIANKFEWYEPIITVSAILWPIGLPMELCFLIGAGFYCVFEYLFDKLNKK